MANTVIRNPRDAALVRLDNLDFKDSVKAATDAVLPANTRTGNVLLADANGAFATVDGVTINSDGTAGDNDGTEAESDHILVKDEATGANNGIYFLSDPGSASKKWRLTRRSDANASSEVTAGLYVFVDQGTTNANSSWVISTSDPITLNTTSLTFTKFSGTGQIVAGTGMTKTGDTLNVIGGDGIVANADDVAVDFNTTNLKITAGQIDTIQSIATGAQPTFAGLTLSGLSAGSIPFAGAGGIIEDNALFFWDDTNNHLGIGAVPLSNLHIEETNTDTLPSVLISQIGTGDAALQFSIFGDAYAMGIDNSDADKFKISYAAATASAVLGTNDRFVIDTAGLIGMGESTPTTHLHINGTGNQSVLIQSISASGAANCSLFNDGGVTDKINLTNLGSTATGTNLGISNNNLGVLGKTGDGNLVIGTLGTGFVAFGTNDIEAMRIDNSQQVGIGVTPGDRLDVLGNITQQGTNAQKTTTKQAVTELTGLSGATVTASNLIPVGSFIIGVTIRVTTTITGATSFDIGDGTDVDRWGAAIALSAGTTTIITDFTAAGFGQFATANDVVLTANGANFTAGAVRITVHYITLTAATS